MEDRRKRNRIIRQRIAILGFTTGALSTLVIVLLFVGISKLFAQAGIESGTNINEAYSTSGALLTPEPIKPSEYPKAEGLLRLVNWDNPTDGTRPPNLVLAKAVLGDEIVLQNNETSIDYEAGVALSRMCRAAVADGIQKYVLTSGYRSVDYQKTLWENRLAQDPDYGKDPFTSPVKVMPGNMSEHATGLAVDILNMEHKNANDEYGESMAGLWLAHNAHKYGFILRYPKDKQHITGVIYEPWHFRYVGEEAAEEIYSKGICLEEYLGKERK